MSCLWVIRDRAISRQFRTRALQQKLFGKLCQGHIDGAQLLRGIENYRRPSFLEYTLAAQQKDFIGRSNFGFKPEENMMRNTLAIALATVFIVGLTALADAKSQKACDIGCSKYTGGQRNSSIYTKCMAKCVQR